MKGGIIAVAWLSAFAQASYAANWLELENNEPTSAKAYRFWGFIQPQYTYNEGSAVEGIAVPPALKVYDGQTSLNNLVGPDFSHQNTAQIFRARPGVRGVIPGTGDKMNYFLLAELGNNGITEVKQSPNSYRYTPALTDATVTFNTSATRIRVGLGRLPLGEEAMHGEPAMNYASLTNVSDQLLNERFVDPYYSGRPEVPLFGVPMTQMTLSGLAGGANNLACATPGHCMGALNDKPVGAFRDIGIEAYDWFNRGKWEYSYALMVSDGNGIEYSNNGNYDISGRLQASYVFGGAGPNRDDASAYVWHQEGKRNYNGQDYTRIREGFGGNYKHDNFRLGGEYIRAKGMIYYGVIAPFNDIGGIAFEPVDQMALNSSDTAKGYYVDMGWQFMPKWEADLRYDNLDKLPNSAYDERLFSTMTYGMQYFFSTNLRFMVNYEVRKISVPNPLAYLSEPAAIQANAHTQLTDAAIIAGSIGNRIIAQCTYTF